MKAAWLLGVLMMMTSAQAQRRPVEIQLVPPLAEIWVAAPSQPTWRAPALPCHLCGEIRQGESCGCNRYLTQELADLLRGELDRSLAHIFAGRLQLTRPILVRAIPSDQLHRMSAKPTLGLYEDGVISLSQDLDRRQAMAVLAHEYGHAWQYQQRQDIDQVENLLFEGFAEWVSFKVLEQIGDRQGTRDVLADHSVYGRGARWYLRLEKTSGLGAVLECARHRLKP